MPAPLIIQWRRDHNDPIILAAPCSYHTTTSTIKLHNHPTIMSNAQETTPMEQDATNKDDSNVSGNSKTQRPDTTDGHDDPNAKKLKPSIVTRRTNQRLSHAAAAASAVASSGSEREVWVFIHVNRLPTSGSYGHQTSPQLLATLLSSLNDGDKKSSTALLPVDGKARNPLQRGHKIATDSLKKYCRGASSIEDPYFSAYVHLTTPLPDEKLGVLLENFRKAQGSGMAIVDPLQDPNPVALGCFVRSNAAMIIRDYNKSINELLSLKKAPPVLLKWDSSFTQPVTEWASSLQLAPASILVAFATAATEIPAAAAVRLVYTDPTVAPPMGRHMMFCPSKELWASERHVIHNVFESHYRSLLGENVTSEIRGLLPMSTPYPDPTSTMTLRDMFLSATEDNTDSSPYLFTSIEQSGIQTRFFFYEDSGTLCRAFIADFNQKVVEIFEAVESASSLYLPGYGPNRAASTLATELDALQQFLPTTDRVATSMNALTLGPTPSQAGDPSFYSALTNGEDYGSSSSYSNNSDNRSRRSNSQSGRGHHGRGGRSGRNRNGGNR